MAGMAFMDITIIAKDEQQSQRDPNNREKCIFVFKTSATPPTEWIEYFAEECRRRKSAGATSLPDVVFNSQFLHLHGYCDMDLQHHYTNLKHDMATANRRYRELLEQRERRRQQEEDDKATERALIKSKLDQLIL